MNHPVFSGMFRELGEEVEAMAKDLHLPVSDVLRIGAARVLREWKRKGSITAGNGVTPDRRRGRREHNRNRRTR